MSNASLLVPRMEPPSAKRPRRKALVLDSDDENDDFVVSPKSKAPAAARTSLVVPNTACAPTNGHQRRPQAPPSCGERLTDVLPAVALQPRRRAPTQQQLPPTPRSRTLLLTDGHSHRRRRHQPW